MDLIHRCQAGDEQAFAALFHGYKNLVYKTAYLMLGDADEAEDVLQEVFVQVINPCTPTSPPGGPSPPGCIASRSTVASIGGVSDASSFPWMRFASLCHRPKAGWRRKRFGRR